MNKKIEVDAQLYDQHGATWIVRTVDDATHHTKQFTAWTRNVNHLFNETFDLETRKSLNSATRLFFTKSEIKFYRRTSKMEAIRKKLVEKIQKLSNEEILQLLEFTNSMKS